MEFYQRVDLSRYLERPAGMWLLDYLALVLEEIHSVGEDAWVTGTAPLGEVTADGGRSRGVA